MLKNGKAVLISLVIFLLALGSGIIYLSQDRGLQVGRIGVDTCIRCGMALAEKRSSASVVFKGDPKTIHFDDIGCLKKHAQKHNLKEITDGIVYDFDSENPIPITRAFFEESTYQTSMGSGIIARERASEKTITLDQLL